MSVFDSKKKGHGEDPELTDEAAGETVDQEIAEDGMEEAAGEASDGKKSGARKGLSWKTNRKLRIGTTATAVTAVVVAAVVLLNVVVGLLNDRFPLNLDLTADGTYTLSEDSHDVADKVTEDVTITVFMQETEFSDPAYGNELDVILRQFYQFTKDYGTLTDGKVDVTYLDLDANPTLSSAYEKYGVTTGSILFQCGDQWRTITVDDLYSMDTSSYYYTGEYTVSSLVEQKLAANINAVCGGKTIVLTFLTGHGEDETYIQSLADLYEMNGYTVETVDYTTANQIHAETGAIIIVAPTEDYTADEITRLRAWMNNGGELGRDLFVFCHYSADCPNLYEFLEVDYGITVTDKLVIETDENNIPMSYYGSLPYYPLTSASVTDLTADVDSGTLIMPLTLQLLTSKESDDTTYSLTNHAMATFPESANLTGLAELMDENATTDSIVQQPAESYPIVGMAYAYEYQYVDNEPVESYVMVSGSYQMIDYISASQYINEDMVLMPMREACSLGDTTVISGKDLSSATVTFSSLIANLLGVGVFTLGIPVVLIVIALVVFFKRRHL